MQRTWKFQLALAIMLTAHLCPSSASATSLEVDAVTKARDDIEIKFTVGGMVTKMHVKRGDHVEKGQALIELEDEENEALIKFFRAQAESNLAVQAAEARYELAEVEERRFRELVALGSASPVEHERAEANKKVAYIEVQQAKLQQKLDRLRLVQYEARHDQYIRQAEKPAVITEVNLSVGETVEALAPVMRLVVLDPLVIDTPVPTPRVDELKVGQPAWVRLKGTDPNQAIQGKIEFINPVADAASDTTLVGIEVSGPRSLKPGQHVTVTFAQPTEMASAAQKGR